MAPIERKKLDTAALQKSNLPVLFIVGGPGSGKGTQCERIVSKYGLTHLSSGDLLRDEVKSGSTRGKQLDEVMQKGELVPLEIVLDLLTEAMLKALGKGTKGFLIDGYPREVEQGLKFEKDVCPCRLVIYFDVSEDTMTNRLLERGKTSGRIDDNVETIKQRLRTFTNATKPVADHYNKQNKLVKIAAEGTVEDIFAEVQKCLDKHFK